MAVATHARRFRKAGAYMALALLLPFATIIDGVADILIKKGVSKRISQIAGTFFALCSLAAAVSISLRACANSVARPAAAAAAAGQNATSNVAHYNTIFKPSLRQFSLPASARISTLVLFIHGASFVC